jgi:hypothetical protein
MTAINRRRCAGAGSIAVGIFRAVTNSIAIERPSTDRQYNSRAAVAQKGYKSALQNNMSAQQKRLLAFRQSPEFTSAS